jgi:mono/diheme cytochrome c family protein
MTTAECCMTTPTAIARRGVAGVLAIVILASAPAALGAQGKSATDIYRDKCAVCHGEDGAGKTAKGKKLKVKDVRETIKKESFDQMVEIATKGKVPDMEAFGKDFTPEQIRQLVTYYRDLAAKK